MDIKSAFTLSRKTGCKIQHRYFLPHEYITIQENKVIDEQGLITDEDKYMEFWKSNPYFQKDWQTYNENKNPNVRVRTTKFRRPN